MKLTCKNCKEEVITHKSGLCLTCFKRLIQPVLKERIRRDTLIFDNNGNTYLLKRLTLGELVSFNKKEVHQILNKITIDIPNEISLMDKLDDKVKLSLEKENDLDEYFDKTLQIKKLKRKRYLKSQRIYNKARYKNTGKKIEKGLANLFYRLEKVLPSYCKECNKDTKKIFATKKFCNKICGNKYRYKIKILNKVKEVNKNEN